MILAWAKLAWDDYVYWLDTDRKKIGRINKLIKAIQRTPFQGLGGPEPLKHDLAGYWSRRIDREHRLIFKVDGDNIFIIQCRYHY
ncbi:MAG: Txe/YoeB family addiction module toxin [Acidobacteria bacterium]|nr:Txe/YoeB family addiction module toxin [Acidobacteriota bacterium]